MRTFQQFREATEKDLKAMGANPNQISTLKKRAAARGEKGFGTSGSTGSHFHQKSGALMKRPVSRAVPSKDSAIVKRPTSAITKPADKGASIVRHKNQVAQDREDAKASARQKLASGSAGKPRLTPMSPEKRKASAERQRDELKYKKDLKTAKDRPGFMGGVKKSFGGDAFMNTKTNGKQDPAKVARKRDARREMGQKVGNAIKSVPGKAVKSGVGLLKKGIDSTKGGSVGSSSSGNLGGPTISQGGRTSK